MFRISKFQKSVNIFKCEFFFRRNVNMPMSRIFFKMLTVTRILFPCFFICFNIAFAYEESKLDHGYFVPVNGIFNDFLSVSTSSISKRIIREQP